MQDYVTPLPLLALLAAHGGAVAALSALLLSPGEVQPGWAAMRPSATHWFCFLGAWAFSALMSWIWLFVGSARSDAAFQMKVALALALIFCAAAIWCGFQMAFIRRIALRWRGQTITWRQGGKEMRQTFADFEAIRTRWDSMHQIRFRDQSILTLDPYARGTDAFLARLSEAVGEPVDG